MSTEHCPIKVKLVAPPLYVVVANTLDKEIGLATVRSGVEKIREVIESFGGELAIKMEVREISYHSDSSLLLYLNRMISP